MGWNRKVDLRSTVPGPQGPQGLPGVNAVENDNAVAAYILSALSAVRSALVSLFSRKDEYDPRDYGAKGDGITDDTQALRDCIAAAGVGGSIRIPMRWSSFITGTLTLMDGQQFRGRWVRSSMLFATSDITMIRAVGGQNQAVRQLRVRNWFVGVRTTYDVEFVNPTKPVIQDVEIDLATGTRMMGGVRFVKDTGQPGNTIMPQLSRVWVRNGHLVIDGVTDGHAVDCFIWAVNTGSRAAIDVTNISNGWTFQAVDVIPSEGSGSGYRFEQTWQTNINGGYIDGSYPDQDTGYGVRMVGGGQLFMSATRFYHLGRSAILLENSNGSSFSAIGFDRNNKQNNSYPDIDLINSSYNTFSGTAHTQPTVRTNKGAQYREDSTSVHNSFDQAVYNLSSGDNYAYPLVQSNAGTLGTRCRPGALYPRPSMVPTFIAPPAAVMGSFTAQTWPAANRAQFHRFHVTNGGVYRYTGVRIEVGSGNVQAAVVRMDGLNWTRVMASPVTSSAAQALLSLDMGSTYLAPGEYALVLWADNATVQIPQVISEGVRTSRMAAEVSSLTGGIPASGSIAAWSTNRAASGLTLTNSPS